MSRAPLEIEQSLCAAGKEWVPSFAGWAVVWVRSGIGYWISQAQPIEVKAGDLLALSPICAGRFRSSRLGEGVVLEHFLVQSDALIGLTTLAERRDIDLAAKQSGQAPRRFPANDPLAQRFVALSTERNQTGMDARCRRLQLWIDATSSDLPRSPSSGLVPNSPLDRFKNLLGAMPESDLLAKSADELAATCGCSVRHFRRIFRELFQQSIRAKQIELRLTTAKQLLRDPKSKVIDVAYATGYNHLGLFNLMFKRRFAMTPTDWRRQTTRRKPSGSGRAVLLALMGWVASIHLLSAEAPAARPSALTSTGTNTPTFIVQRYEVEGNTLLSAEALDSVLGPYTGPAVSIDTLKKALGELQLELRRRGFATVAVNFPPQEITNGVVKIRSVEGLLADVIVIGNLHFGTNNVLRSLPSLHSNQLLNSHVFQAELDRANSNPDRQIYPQIFPGPEPGTTALQLRVKDRLPLHGKLELNNQSTPGTPTYRLNASAQYNNLWDREHSVGLQYGFSPEQFKSGGFEQFYDSPLIAYYSAYYRMPLGPPTALAEALANNPRTFGYDEATRQFNLPRMTGRSDLTVYASRSTSDTGVKRSPRVLVNPGSNSVTQIFSQDSGRDLTLNETIGARISWPLPLFGSIRSALSFGADFKSFELHSFNTNNFITHSEIPGLNLGDPVEIVEGTTAHSQPLRTVTLSYLPLSVRWEGQIPDDNGSTSFSMSYSANFRSHAFSDRAQFEALAGSSAASGNFFAANWSLGREQRFANDWSLQLRADGQWASEPLVSMEQFALGGVAGVRGYQEGETYGDRGWRITSTTQSPWYDLGLVDNQLPIRVRALAFLDCGRDYLLDRAGSKRPDPMLGAGVGVAAAIGRYFDFRLSAAWPLLETANTKANEPRFHLALSAQF